jgi:sarcosine oxidase
MRAGTSEEGTMVKQVDVLVIGGGAMGLSTAWWLVPQAQVAVLERFDPGHHRGASHGDERIFRYLYSDPAYVEMALAAEEGWQRLERATGKQLVHRVGCVQHGSYTDMGDMVRVADRFDVATEHLTADEAMRRWPAMGFTSDVLLQPAAGWVGAAESLAGLTDLIAAAGAELRFGTQVVDVEVHDDGVRAQAGGTTYEAETLVVTAGAWTTELLAAAELPLPPLVTTEEHVFFFRRASASSPGGVPSWLHLHDRERYGLPGPSELIKIGEHHTGTVTTGDTRSFAADPVRAARMEDYVGSWFPGLVPEVVHTTTCLYTSTPTRDFVLDRRGQVVVGAGFSGHGFKFAPEIGRRLAGLALGEATTHPRFALR